MVTFTRHERGLKVEDNLAKDFSSCVNKTRFRRQVFLTPTVFNNRYRITL